MKETRAPKIRKAMERELEKFAAEDGIQRGMFIDTSGKLRCERVTATSQISWLYKTIAGKPYSWWP